MADVFPSLSKQIAEVEENLRLIAERKAEFPQQELIPLDLIKNEYHLREQLADLQARRARLQEVPCPYRSLEYFEAQHAEFYFGREAMVQKLLVKLQGSNFLVLVGPSGSGKSSLVRAGLVAALRDSALPQSASWGVDILRPGSDPLHALAVPLADRLAPGLSPVERLAETRKLADHLAAATVPMDDILAQLRQTQPSLPRVLLIVDQFEEAFTLCTDENRRQSFFEVLLAAIQAPWVTVILTLRADFYGRVLADARLSQHVDQGLVNVMPMTVDERRAAIEQPALQTGRRFEGGLVQRILDAVADAPGDLPLLEFALTELWAQQTGDGLLTHAAYDAIGEVRGAIAKRADETLNSLNREQQHAVQGIFTRLVQVARPDEPAEDTRRRIELAELAPEMRDLVRQLADARLLVTGRDAASGEEIIEVAHEALIRSWGHLRTWLNRDREFLLWRQHLRILLEIWRESECTEVALLRGALLREAQLRSEDRADDLNSLELTYIRESELAAEREVDAEEAARERELSVALQLIKTQNRRAFNLRLALGIAVVAVIIISVLLVLTVEARLTAESNGKARYEAQQTAIASADLANQQLALLEGERLVLEADRLKEQGAAEGAIAALRAAVKLNPYLKIDLPAEEADVRRHIATQLVLDGEKLARTGRYEVAFAKYRTALDLQPPPDAPIYVWVPPGEFAQGSGDSDPYADPREKPQHKVSLDGFWIMRTEVTNGQYLRCMEAGPCTEPGDRDYRLSQYSRRPVASVDWEQANTYARWVGGRLPTEAEWEKACRGTDGRIWPWDSAETSDELAHYEMGLARDVGSYPGGASPYGIVDMAGNVSEWTSSGYEKYPYRADDGREGPDEVERVVRGGSSFDMSWETRCAIRSKARPHNRQPDLGFRVVASPSHP